MTTIEFKKPPGGTLLYKYYPPNNAALVLSNQKIRFSPFIEFNDPFELNTFSTTTYSIKEFSEALSHEILEAIINKEELTGSNSITNFVKGYINGSIPEIAMVPAEDFAAEMGSIVSEKNFSIEPSLFTQAVYHRLSKVMGAFCLSEKNNDLLMWAHYAKNHEGIALGLDVNKAGDSLKFMRPIEYRETYPTDEDPKIAASTYLGRNVRTMEIGWDVTKKMYFTKSIEWSYEKEWRAIKDSECDPMADHRTYEINSQLMSLPSESFSAIYIGCRCDRGIAIELIEKAKKINPSIKIFSSRISTNSYKLEFDTFK